MEFVQSADGTRKGYYVLDGYGSIYPFGDVPGFEYSPSWPNWDIARDIEVVYDCSGNIDGYYVIDGQRGVHAVGNVPYENVSSFYDWMSQFMR